LKLVFSFLSAAEKSSPAHWVIVAWSCALAHLLDAAVAGNERKSKETLRAAIRSIQTLPSEKTFSENYSLSRFECILNS
jgi:phosphotransacetylase